MPNVNFTLHPLPVLLNYGEIEKNPKTFRHYMDGITPLISEQMHRMDEERVAAGKSVGFTLTPTLEMLKTYYTCYGMNATKTIYEYVNRPETPYADLVGRSRLRALSFRGRSRCRRSHHEDSRKRGA